MLVSCINGQHCRRLQCCRAIEPGKILFARGHAHLKPETINPDNIWKADPSMFQGESEDVAIAMAKVAWSTKGEDVTVRMPLTQCRFKCKVSV